MTLLRAIWSVIIDGLRWWIGKVRGASDKRVGCLWFVGGVFAFCFVCSALSSPFSEPSATSATDTPAVALAAEVSTEEPEPTEKPTEEPEPTEKPTEEPEPTEKPTEEPEPTEVPDLTGDPNLLFTQPPEPVGNSRSAWVELYGEGSDELGFGRIYEVEGANRRIWANFSGEEGYVDYVQVQWYEAVSWDEASTVANGFVPSDAVWLERYVSDVGTEVDLYTSNRLTERLSDYYEFQGVQAGLLMVSFVDNQNGVEGVIIATPAEVDLIGSQKLANGFDEPVQVAEPAQVVAEPTQMAEPTQVLAEPTQMAEPTQVLAEPTQMAEPTNPPFTCIGGCATAPDPSCSIKGNVNPSKETWIYHVEGGQYYEKTDIKPEEGDRWFCTWQEAEEAGFRASKR